MYVGDYLSTNLGHEVINMFQADNGGHYLYLNARGNFTSSGKKVGTMLLVRGIGEGRVEVVGMAKNLQPVESACCTLPRDIGRINTEVRNAQELFLKDVKYGGVSIFEIFGDEGQQSVYASYWVNDKSFFTPKKRLIINFKNSTKKENTDITLANHNFASTSLHQFIDEAEDLRILTEICGDKNLWEVSNEKLDINKYNNDDGHTISLFDICQIQNDENRFSNALSYFIQQYPKWWKNLLQDFTNIKDLGEIESVTREENAKVDNEEYKSKTGGRIDLLIRTKNYYIIIENKIDSEIIEDNGITQLSRYYHYVKYLKEEQITILNKEKDILDKTITEQKQKVNNPRNKNSKYRNNWEEKIKSCNTQLKYIKEQIDEVNNKGIVGIVLTPNYNPPKKEQLTVQNGKQQFIFKELTYKYVYEWLGNNATEVLESDNNFKYFYNAMKRHTYDYESEALYAEMLENLVRRIKEKPNNSSSKVVSRTDPNNPNQGIVRPEDGQLPEGFEPPTGDLISEELGEAIRKSEGY